MRSLQYITAANERFTHIDGAEQALRGGCRWIQLRMKGDSDEEIVAVGRELKRLCQAYGAKMILDDHVELVKRVEADGVHLGLCDMPIAEARVLLGNQYIIGGTANTIDDIRQHQRDGADYIGCGPYRSTTTKKNLAPTLGLAGYQNIIAQTKEEGITLPIVAIGGIEIADIPQLMQIGLSGVAISGAILNARDPIQTTNDIIRLLDQ